MEKWQKNVYGEKEKGTKKFKKNFRLKKSEESPFNFVLNAFERKAKLRTVYSKRGVEMLSKRDSFEFWNYDDNNLGNDLLREILHYSKNYKGLDNSQGLQFQNTAAYLKSNLYVLVINL